MNQIEFIKKLSDKFPKDFSQTDSDDLSAWLERRVDESRIDDLYWNIIESYEYKTFPTLAFIASCTPGPARGDKDPAAAYCQKTEPKIAEWKKMQTRDILKKYQECRGRLSNDTASMMDKEFIHLWGGLYAEYSFCKNQGLQPVEQQRHCEYVKDCIVSNRPYQSIKWKGEPVILERKDKMVPIGYALKDVL